MVKMLNEIFAIVIALFIEWAYLLVDYNLARKNHGAINT